MWWLAIGGAVCLGSLVVAWWMHRRLERLLAAQLDERARDAHSARAEVAQLRRGMADHLVVQAAAAVVDNALHGRGSQEPGA